MAVFLTPSGANPGYFTYTPTGNPSVQLMLSTYVEQTTAATSDGRRIRFMMMGIRARMHIREPDELIRIGYKPNRIVRVLRKP